MNKWIACGYKHSTHLDKNGCVRRLPSGTHIGVGTKPERKTKLLICNRNYIMAVDFEIKEQLL